MKIRVRYDERGFSLPVVLLVILAISALGLSGIAMARQGLRTYTKTNARTLAFYAAETGVARGLENWTAPAMPAPDSTWLLDQGTLANGASYSVEATSLDDGNSIYALYVVRSTGSVGDLASQTSGLLVRTMPLLNPFQAALRVKEDATVTGNVDVIGHDMVPAAWGTNYCDLPGADEAGITVPDDDDLSQGGSANIDGDPPVEENPDTANFFDFGDVRLDDIIADADITIPGGTTVSGSRPQPSYLADGSCDISDDYNWGDPDNVGQPCSSWFPTIYADGNLRLEGNKSGQGLLIVNGDLTVKGGFEFYGPVVVTGQLISEGSFSFHGGVLANSTQLSSGNVTIQYSACSLQRALSRSASARPRPVPDRAWFSGR